MIVSFKEPLHFFYAHTFTQTFTFNSGILVSEIVQAKFLIQPLVVVILFHARWTELFTITLRTFKMQGTAASTIPATYPFVV